MSTDVTKFDAASYVDKVRDKIKQSLIDVIPDEQWNAMLKAEISAFFESKPATTGWNGTPEKVSEFRRIATAVIHEETKAKIREMLSGKEWTEHWDGTKHAAGEEIVRLVRENGHAIMAKWLESAIQQVISSIRLNPHQ